MSEAASSSSSSGQTFADKHAERLQRLKNLHLKRVRI